MTLLDRLHLLEEFSCYRHSLPTSSCQLPGGDDGVDVTMLMAAASVSPALFGQVMQAASYWSEDAGDQIAAISSFLMGFALGRTSHGEEEMPMDD